MRHARLNLLAAALLGCAMPLLPAQGPPHENPNQLTESGHTQLAGHATPYVIHQLPVSSFPDLPAAIADSLNRRDCLIPQTYEAHRPENVVHASLERAGSSDWAVLCAVNGNVSLMVFFASAPERPMILATAQETDRLQKHDPIGVLGFNWGIDPASPQRVHDAQTGLPHRPATLDHDALADAAIEHRTVFHFYSKGKWTLLDLPE
ncbi:MAG: hypothetical protein ACLPH3_24740 [Terracidiphilus sp.]